MIKVAVTGAAGRMGSGIIRKITEQDDMEVVAAIEMPNTPLAGRDAGLQAGTEELGVEIVGSEKLEEALKASGAEVLVDFFVPLVFFFVVFFGISSLSFLIINTMYNHHTYNILANIKLKFNTNIHIFTKFS